MNPFAASRRVVERSGARPVHNEEPRGPRLLYIDNLRWTMIILVISMHAADTYSPFGNWYFVERRPMSTAAVLVFAAWQMYLQSFFMGLLFFIAGYFVPSSLDRKGARTFLRDRAFRLGVPVLLYMFCIGPVTEYDMAHSWTSTEPTSFANEWVKHIRNGQFLQENGPLWFCLALLIFSTAYAAVQAFDGHTTRSGTGRPAPGVRKLIAFAVVMGACTFLVRTSRPAPFMNMHLEDFPQYILLFGAGVAAARHKWLSEFRFRDGVRWLSLALPAGLAAWLSLLIFGGELQRRGVDLSGGWHWQSGVFCLWEAFTCVALCLGLLVFFREKLNSQGRVAKFLSENAFSVYVFHPPIVILAARLMSGANWHPLIKFLILTGISAIIAFELSAVVFRRIPLLRRVL
jgi:fucose 4-O-acetylase-like acetyltransferase